MQHSQHYQLPLMSCDIHSIISYESCHATFTASSVTSHAMRHSQHHQLRVMPCDIHSIISYQSCHVKTIASSVTSHVMPTQHLIRLCLHIAASSVTSHYQFYKKTVINQRRHLYIAIRQYTNNPANIVLAASMNTVQNLYANHYH